MEPSLLMLLYVSARYLSLLLNARMTLAAYNLTFIDSEKHMLLFVQKSTFRRAYSEAVVRMCSVKEFFLKVLLNLQENTCATVLFLIRANVIKKETMAKSHSCEFSEILKNTLFHRTSPVAASIC